MGTVYLGAPGATDQQTRAKSLAEYVTLNTIEEANDRCRIPDDSTAEDEHSDHNRTNFNPRQAPAWAPFTFQGLSYELRYAARRQPGRRGRRSRWSTPAGRGRRAGSEGPGRRSEVGRGCRSLPTSVFCVVRARSAWGEEPEKVSRPLWATCRRATLRVQGRRAGFGSEGRRRTAWNPAWTPRPSGHGCTPSTAAGALTRSDGDDITAGTTGCYQVAVPRF